MDTTGTDVKSIFGRALAISSATERAGYLEQACRGDPALRAEVESLLAALEGAGDFLKQPAAGPGATVDSDPGPAGSQGDFAAVPAEAVGNFIGPYKLLQRLGEGGMGVVWVAEQAEPVKRRVALKIIKPGMDSAQVIRRFEQERQALALMDHTHIAKVFDAGASEAGRPYFVMELVKGVPITKYCDEVQLPIRERLELFVPVCQAIQHAHQKGIIHRDIKPSNVLVCMQDGKPVAKVIDFGVAKAVNQRLTDESMYTEIGQIVGTLEYMSPEQAELSPLDIDTRADVYALGVLLYELLTGSTPLDRKQLRRAALAEAMRLIREEVPPKPSTRLNDSKDTLPSLAAQRRTQPARLTREVRGELDWIVMKCLDKDRTRRYETANGLARDLERHMHNEPVEAGPPSAGYRLKKFASKHRKLLGTVSAFVLLLLLGVLASVWQAVRARQAEQRAVAETQEATKERNEKQAALTLLEAEQTRTKAALAAETKARRQTHSALTTMTDEVIEKLLAKRPQLGDNEKAFLRKVLSYYQAFASEKGETEEARFVAAEGHYRVAKLRAFLGEATEAMAGYREAVRLLEKLVAEFPTVSLYRQVLAYSYAKLSLLLNDLGNPNEAEMTLRQSLALIEKLSDEFPAERTYRSELASSRYNLGRLLHLQGKGPEAAAAFRQAQEILEKLAAEFPTMPFYRQQLAYSHNMQGELLKALRRWPQAEAALHHALELREKLAADFPTDADYRDGLALSYFSLGALAHTQGNLQTAERPYRRALAIREKLVADFPTAPDYRSKLAQSHNSLGQLLLEQGKRPQAQSAFRQALEIQQKLATDFPTVSTYRQDLASIYSDRGNLLRKLGQRPEAEMDHRQALAIRGKLVGDFPTMSIFRLELGDSYYSLGVMFREQSKWPEAETACRRALAIQEKLAADFPRTAVFRQVLARSHNNLGVLLCDLDRRMEAEAAYRQAFQIQEKLAANLPTVPSRRTELAGSYVNLGVLLCYQGRIQEGLDCYDKAIPLLEGNLEKDVRQPEDRVFLSNAYWGRARALTKLKRYDEALKDWGRAAARDNGPELPNIRLERAVTLARSGDHARAVTEADYLTTSAKTPGSSLYNAACVYSVSAGLVTGDAPLKEQYAGKALALLRHAQAAGYFRDARIAEHLQKDGDLAALRDRADFKAFVAELEKQLMPKGPATPPKPKQP